MSDSLAGLRVLDFSRVLAGPFATMMLADFGADVTKVERPGVGDETRSWGPPYDDRGQATYFQSVNRNKHSIALDLKLDAELQRARELALACDVLVENFRPGVMDSLGLGYGELQARNPGLIYCSITGFGSGDGALLPGYDLLVQALGGLMSITGTPDGEPQKVGVALVDVLAGLFSTVGILAAVRHREVTGCGQLIEVSLLSALLGALVNQGSAYTIAGLCEVLGAPELAADARFATNGDRVANREVLRAKLLEALRRGSAREWARMLTEARVPAGVVNDIGEAFELARALGLHPTVSVRRDDGGEVSLASNPVRMSETPPRYRTAPPPLPQRRGV
jgi:crotonobetainyl-CoA:carnitine CoA-transferase CaiB-like acyl-CoA transferase